MKRIASLILFTALIVLSSSCKKEHTCTCTDGKDTSVLVFPKTTHNEAQLECAKTNPYYNSPNVGYSCDVKPE